MLPCWLLAATLAVGQTSSHAPAEFSPDEVGGVQIPFHVRAWPVSADPASPASEAATSLNLWPMVAPPESSELSVNLAQPAPPKGGGAPEPKPTATSEPKRRALPAPLPSPPMPSGEWQGYPLIGVPVDTTRYLLMKALQGTGPGDLLDTNRIRVYGWLNAAGNLSTSRHSNMPDSYWIVPNSFQLDQAVLRAERQVDSVQTDHIDWGFRSTLLFGIDYRYMVAGGWEPAATQLLKHNFLYGLDPTEQYIDVYFPQVAQGMIVRVGRWIACPDIETQFAPDNYLGTHSILFTFDT